MPITIIDREGTLATVPSDSRAFRRAIERGEIAATGTPLVYRLIRESGLRPLTPAEKRAQFLKDARK